MTTSLDIIFVFPPAHGNPGVFKNHLGVAYLRAALLQTGITSDQYKTNKPGSIESVAADILTYRPRIVGFTAYDANFPNCLALAMSLRRHAPHVKIILGGPTATFGAKNILSRHDALDFLVCGEAEESGPLILQRMLGSDEADFELLPGVAFRRKGKVFSTGLPPLVGCNNRDSSNLDSVPSPYLAGLLTDGRPGILSGRGCTYHCQYCCFAALGRKRLRLHTIDRVLAELDYIACQQRRSGERYVVAIHDDTFTILPDRAKQLCQAIADRSFGLMLSCITRADKVDSELLRLMREAGFVSLAYGLESAVPSVLRATGKVRPPDWADPDLVPEREFVEHVRKNVLAAKNLGFNVGLSIILGLPTETAEEGAATLKFLGELPIDYYMHNFLWVFPGTPLWETHKNYGLECDINSLGLATTVKYSYDITRLRPRAKCSLEQDAQLIRLLTAHTLFGCEAFVGDRHHVTAAVIESDKLSEHTANWLASILDIGAIVIQVYPPMKHLEKLIRLYEDRTVFAEQLIPARHYIQALAKNDRHPGRNIEERWLLACSGVDLYCTHKPKLVLVTATMDAIPLQDWANELPVTSDLCEPIECLTELRAVNSFLDRLDQKRIETSLRKMPVPPGLKYPGRWLTGRAPCLSLTRLEIDAKENIRSCRHGQVIGSVGDELKQMAFNLSVITKTTEQRRGCNACSNSHCPRCPFPGFDDETYCRIMSQQERVLVLMNKVHLYSRLPLILEYQRDTLGNE